MTEELFHNFCRVLTERLQIYKYKYDFTYTYGDGDYQFGFQQDGIPVYYFWCDLTHYRIVVGEVSFVFPVNEVRYETTIDLFLAISSSLFPLLFKSGVISSYEVLVGTLLDFKFSSWKSFISKYLDDFGFEWIETDCISIPSMNLKIFINSEGFYCRYNGMEFVKKISNDLDIINYLCFVLSLIIDMDGYNILTGDYVLPIQDVSEEPLESDFGEEELQVNE